MLWDKEVAIARLYIVGAGPAGISAAIWAKRLGWDPIILERTRCLGGQLNEFTLPIVDLPGQPDVLATELAHALDEQLQRLGVGIEYGCQVVGFSDLRLIFADGGSVESSHVIYAPGVRTRRLAVAGIEEVVDRSASAILAGSRAGIKVLVVGGGDRAAEAASRLAEAQIPTVLVHRRASLRARTAFRNRLAASGAAIRLKSRVLALHRASNGGVLVDLCGSDGMEHLQVTHVLVRIGMEPDLTSGLERVVANARPEFRLIGDAAECPPYRSLVVAFASGMRAVKEMVLAGDRYDD